MAKRNPFYGPRLASYEVQLDGHGVTNTGHGGREMALRQAQDPENAHRSPRVIRFEACAHPQCSYGKVPKKYRGKGVVGWDVPMELCPQCNGEGPILCDEIIGEKAFYVSARDDRDRYSLVAGPYATHAEALAAVNAAREAAMTIDDRSWWYSWGTCKSPIVPAFLGVI